MINKTVCFSGHRPEKLPGKGIDSREETIFIKKLLKTKIERYISEGYTRFLSGTARGIDLWAAQIVLEIKKSNSFIFRSFAFSIRYSNSYGFIGILYVSQKTI